MARAAQCVRSADAARGAQPRRLRRQRPRRKACLPSGTCSAASTLHPRCAPAKSKAIRRVLVQTARSRIDSAERGCVVL
eukprot:2954595-Rhodomonas_salina.3